MLILVTFAAKNLTCCSVGAEDRKFSNAISYVHDLQLMVWCPIAQRMNGSTLAIYGKE